MKGLVGFAAFLLVAVVSKWECAGEVVAVEPGIVAEAPYSPLIVPPWHAAPNIVAHEAPYVLPWHEDPKYVAHALRYGCPNELPCDHHCKLTGFRAGSCGPLWQCTCYN
ncbi:uncharacterized protein LOC144137560 [Haemaphysalis longicornis]